MEEADLCPAPAEEMSAGVDAAHGRLVDAAGSVEKKEAASLVLLGCHGRSKSYFRDASVQLEERERCRVSWDMVVYSIHPQLVAEHLQGRVPVRLGDVDPVDMMTGSPSGLSGMAREVDSSGHCHGQMDFATGVLGP